MWEQQTRGKPNNLSPSERAGNVVQGAGQSRDRAGGEEGDPAGGGCGLWRGQEAFSQLLDPAAGMKSGARL